MENDKRKNFILSVVYILAWAACIFVLFKWGIPYLLPFIIAFVIAGLIQPAARFLSRWIRIPQKVVSAVLVTLVYALLAFLLLMLGAEIVAFVKGIVVTYNTKIGPFITGVFDSLESAIDTLSPDLASYVRGMSTTIVNSLGSRLATYSTQLLTSLVSATPQTFLRVVITVIATFFTAMDFGVLKRGLASRISEEKYNKLHTGIQHFKKTIFKFLGSYALIFIITFVQLGLGLMLVGIDNAWLIAFAVAVFDVLPIVGSGMVMLPWTLITLLRGIYGRGIGLMCVWLFVVVSRQFIEPRIVGQRVGLHPLITLVAMTVGFRLFGGIGLLGFPIICALIVSLQDAGVVRLLPVLREIPEDEVSLREKRRREQRKHDRKNKKQT